MNKKNIITKNINSLQFIELRDCMQGMIEESMKALDSHQAENLLWYEDCTMEDYFHMWQEIWDDDVKAGDGIDTIAHSYVLNDHTRADFEEAFEQARDAAFKSVMEDIAEEINDADIELEQIEHDDSPEWDGDIEGYERIGSDEELQTDFDGYHGLYNTLTGIVGMENMSVHKFAAWAGATAVWEAKDRWLNLFYKKD